MGRDDGFAIADVAVGYFDDEKVRRLWRRLSPDVGAMCEALALHQAALLASWREGRRVDVESAAPLWLPVRQELVDHLTAVGLLDKTRRVSARSWSSWYGPAAQRREERREAGRKGGLAKAERLAKASPKRSSSSARAELYPSVPSVPSEPSSARAAARGGGAARAAGPESLYELLEGTPVASIVTGPLERKARR
jgi:hypothetical protein